MKNWGTWAFVVGGLTYVMYSQSTTLGQPNIDQSIVTSSGSAAIQENRAIPYDTPPSVPKVYAMQLSFGSYPCGSDCSKDEAGYRWAIEQGINDPDDCTGNTSEFIEGCRVYARSHVLASG